MSGTALEAPPAASRGTLHHQRPEAAQGAPPPPSNARTRAGGRVAHDMPAPHVLAVRVVPHSRRTPFVEVEIGLGPIALVVGVVATRTRWLEARMPESISGGPAVILPPEVVA